MGVRELGDKSNSVSFFKASGVCEMFVNIWISCIVTTQVFSPPSSVFSCIAKDGKSVDAGH